MDPQFLSPPLLGLHLSTPHPPSPFKPPLCEGDKTNARAQTRASPTTPMFKRGGEEPGRLRGTRHRPAPEVALSSSCAQLRIHPFLGLLLSTPHPLPPFKPPLSEGWKTIHNRATLRSSASVILRYSEGFPAYERRAARDPGLRVPAQHRRDRANVQCVRGRRGVLLPAPFTEGRLEWGKGMRGEVRVRERTGEKELGALWSFAPLLSWSAAFLPPAAPKCSGIATMNVPRSCGSNERHSGFASNGAAGRSALL